jgi:hypothetical protein
MCHGGDVISGGGGAGLKVFKEKLEAEWQMLLFKGDATHFA